MLTDAHEKGAKFILGKPGYQSPTGLTPAILTGVTKDMKLWDEESCGRSINNSRCGERGGTIGKTCECLKLWTRCYPLHERDEVGN